MSDETTAVVLETAIKTEQEGVEFYLKVAAASGNKLARGMFEALAADEKRHEEWLKASLADKAVPESGLAAETNKKLQTVFSSVTEADRDAFASSGDDTAALEHARDIEEKSTAYYEKWAEESSAEEVKQLCGLIAAEERNHVKIVSNMLEYLNETGNWFMDAEGWSFDGGGSFA